MQAPRNPSRTSSYASTSGTGSVSPQHAALLGATNAFGRSAPKAESSHHNYSGSNGALAAATSVGTGSPSPNARLSKSPASPLLRDTTGESVRSVKSNRGRQVPFLGSSPMAHLGVPQDRQRGPSVSPSRQAASLAAARTSTMGSVKSGSGASQPRTQPIQRPAVGPKPRRLSGNQDMVAREEEKPTDSTPIPPTTSLVDLFERNSSISGAGGKRPEPVIIKQTKDMPISSPKPVRSSGGITSLFELELDRAAKLPQPDPRTTTNPEPRKPPLRPMGSSSGSYASASEDPTQPMSASTAQRPIRSDVRPSSRSLKRADSSLSSSTSNAIRIPTSTAGNVLQRAETFSPSSASAKSIPAQYRQMYPARKMTPSMTGDQLANAMVAGSLASSRAPSPRKMEPPPPSSRRHKHRSHLGFSRTPSPTKGGMRHTLRNEESESSSDDDEEGLHPYGKHKKKRLVRKHPNKHHEGDRKRWRDAVTERERKRYEGVWAANKGLHCSFTIEEQMTFKKSPNSQQTSNTKEAAADQVSNIVVRDIWNRSRLPPFELENVWDLVDSTSTGRLGKEEFVVGMWLIDQRLKGRKLPVKVSETVWASVRGLQGIKIRK